MNGDGSSQGPLTGLTASIPNNIVPPKPAWSSDGSKLVFAWSAALNGSDAANTNSTANIWVVNADGSGMTPLTKLTAKNADSQTPTRP
jgi:Tol biopolymer transport system component